MPDTLVCTIGHSRRTIGDFVSRLLIGYLHMPGLGGLRQAYALVVRSVCVQDIIGPHRRQPHARTWLAQVDGLEVTYPANALPQGQVTT